MRNLNSSKELYKFYGDPLKEYWKKNRKLEDLYDLLACLHKKDKIKPETVQDQFVRHKNLSQNLLDGVIFLLMETDFYLSFFDIGMIPRVEMINSERMAYQYYRLLKNSIAPDDLFWGRWLSLYEVRYNSDRFNDTYKKTKFEELKNRVHSEKYFEKEKLVIQKKNNSAYNEIQKRLDLFDHFFALSYYQSYRGWLKHSGQDGISELEVTKIESKIDGILADIERYFNKISTSDHVKEKFFFDYRINLLYFKGSKLIGSEITHFKCFEKKLRSKILEKGEAILDETMPEMTDNLQYRIWYDFYRYLHLQRVAENFIIEKDYYSGLKQIALCLELLNEIERKLQGSFSRILLKVKYQKRGMAYIQNSIEAFLIEKELEEPYSYEYKLHEQKQIQRDSTFESIQIWMMEVRKEIFNRL